MILSVRKERTITAEVVDINIAVEKEERETSAIKEEGATKEWLLFVCKEESN